VQRSCRRSRGRPQHHLVARGQVTAEPGTVVAGALDRPQSSSRRELVGEPQRGRIPAWGRRHRPLRDDSSRGHYDHGKHVLISVSVHTDDVIQFVCKHLTDPPARFAGSGTPVWSRETARQVCDESSREGGQAPDQANSGRQTGAAVHTRTIHSQGTLEHGLTPEESRATRTTPRLATAPDGPTYRVSQTPELQASESPNRGAGLTGASR
jgi:hypothetical protein